jgi:hypothetical protein
MKHRQFLIFSTLFFCIISCTNNQSLKKPYHIIDGRCVYEKFKTIVYVSGYEKNENDSIVNVKFSIRDNLLNEKLIMTSEEILSFGSEVFDDQTIMDSSLNFMLNYEIIKEGGCYPYNLISVTKIYSTN